MGQRPLKYKTAHAYGTHKRKSPTVQQTASRSPGSTVQHNTEVADAQPRTPHAGRMRTRADDAVQEPPLRTSHAGEMPTCVDDVEELLSGTSYVAETSRANSNGTIELVVPRSTSSYASSNRASDVSDSLLGTLNDVAMPSTSTGGTIQARLEPHFVSAEASREVAAKVQAKLTSVSATARKMELTGKGEVLASTEEVGEFLSVQMTALNALLGKSKCQQCSQPGLSVQLGTRHGLAAQMILTCAFCGGVAKEGSSP